MIQQYLLRFFRERHAHLKKHNSFYNGDLSKESLGNLASLWIYPVS
jgi:hypothetical protein